jgi:GNAT superfamily N-acetyltransferase
MEENVNQDFIIRHIAKDELDDLLDLYTHHLFSEPDQPLPPRAEVEQLWGNMLNNPLLYCFVVEFQGKLVGSCVLTIIPNLTRGARPYGLIENVVTHSDFRRKGFAKALLKHALDFAWETHCYKVMLLSGVHRGAAHGLYESVGFSKDEKIGYIAKP